MLHEEGKNGLPGGWVIPSGKAFHWNGGKRRMLRETGGTSYCGVGWSDWGEGEGHAGGAW